MMKCNHHDLNQIIVKFIDMIYNCTIIILRTGYYAFLVTQTSTFKENWYSLKL